MSIWADKIAAIAGFLCAIVAAVESFGAAWLTTTSDTAVLTSLRTLPRATTPRSA